MLKYWKIGKTLGDCFVTYKNKKYEQQFEPVGERIEQTTTIRKLVLYYV